VAELDEEAVVANQQKQIQLPADWKALHVYLDKQCPLQPVPASRCCKSAPEERFDGRPIEEYLVPADHPFLLKAFSVNVDDEYKLPH
jgi:hypothetical protein